MMSTVKTTTTHEWDMGGWPTNGQLQQMAVELANMNIPIDTKISVRAGDSQMDGPWCIFTIRVES